MKEHLEKRQIIQANWTREHVLNSEQRKELIMKKVLRAQDQSKRHRRVAIAPQLSK